MPRPTHAYRGLAQPSRLQVAALVMEQPGISLVELSEKTGLHANTLRDHARRSEPGRGPHRMADRMLLPRRAARGALARSFWSAITLRVRHLQSAHPS